LRGIGYTCLGRGFVGGLRGWGWLLDRAGRCEGLAERVRGDYYERVKVGSVDEVVARIRGELLIGLRGRRGGLRSSPRSGLGAG
jgi:hypothetical protein